MSGSMTSFLMRSLGRGHHYNGGNPPGRHVITNRGAVPEAARRGPGCARRVDAAGLWRVAPHRAVVHAASATGAYAPAHGTGQRSIHQTVRGRAPPAGRPRALSRADGPGDAAGAG